MKQLSTREFFQILTKNGFQFVRQKGNHKIWKRGEETVSVPAVRLNRMMAQRLIGEHNLKID